MKDLSESDLADLNLQKSKIQYFSFISSAHFKNPSPEYDLLNVLNGVFILLGKPLGWELMQETLTCDDFISKVCDLNHIQLTSEVIGRAKERITACDLEKLKANSKAAYALALWLSSVTDHAQLQKSVNSDLK